MLYRGYEIKTTVRRGCKRLILRCRDGALFLSLPPRTPGSTVEAFLSAHEKWMRDALARHPKTERTGDPAHLYALVERYLPLWQRRMGVKATAVRYRDMVSRWGSCQCGSGKITLNLRLADKDEKCVEYVLVHELCHLLHPDHSPAFYAEMTRLMPDWQERRRNLNGAGERGIP